MQYKRTGGNQCLATKWGGKANRPNKTMLHFLTGNLNKLREAQEILNIPIRGVDLDLPEIQSTDPAKVAEFKVDIAIKKINVNFILEDSGLIIGKDQAIGALIKWIPNNRVVKAYLGEESTAICVFMDDKYNVFKGEVEGKIVESRGNFGWGWDSIFEVNGKTFAEMMPKEKNKISPRRIALEKLKKYLDENQNR